jgi:hypothetical protein
MEKRGEYVSLCHLPRLIERENRGNATRKLPLPNLPGGALIFDLFRRREDQGSHRQTIESTHSAPSMMRAWAAKSTQNAHIVAFWEQPAAVWEEP